MSVAFSCRSRPRVAWSRNCPRCRLGKVKVRTGAAYSRFWYCASGGCGWACWRPPAVMDCPTCRAGMIWSHSRLSVGCPGCGFRVALRRATEKDN
ncbi:hypothetical protein ETAA1_27020 [Urbifossiella limnaea]|uniref:Uncharacterized protein n=1 Tax=Urbifossiella limnaea TaxID=2528023 RepID=A0A517XTC5_9BACT|nr:hypothetical protein ETAA1_27020 [Urbifossiella limnaea]